ncbi:GNAT family N-acetyltransferase [Nocardia wallacei]|uniref:GNAT family N-acetyltransferase n=1 Tax=Nocardia wallacei TaxID=480035 RepID=UPI002458F33C|nr:GNAT family N-acetyltransferase [Nocardia wallacei]
MMATDELATDYYEEMLYEGDSSDPVAVAVSPEALLRGIVEGTRAERYLAMRKWAELTTGKDMRVTQRIAWGLELADMKTGEGKTLLTTVKTIDDAIQHGVANVWTSSDSLVLETIASVQQVTRSEHGELPVDTYRLADMTQDGDFPAATPGRGQMFVGTPENAEFLVLRRGKAFLDRLNAAGAPDEAITALRERLFPRLREKRLSLDEITDALDEAAEHYGLDERFEPLPGGRGDKVHTLDEMDTVVDGREAVLSPGAGGDEDPETVARLAEVWQRFKAAQGLPDGLTARDFGRPEGTRGFWRAVLTPEAIAKLNRVGGEPVTVADAEMYTSAALAEWARVRNSDYIESRGDIGPRGADPGGVDAAGAAVEGRGDARAGRGKVLLLASDTNDQLQANREEGTETRTQGLVGQFMDLKEGVPVRANLPEEALYISVDQLIGSSYLGRPTGYSGTLKIVEAELYDRYGIAGVAQNPPYYVSQLERHYPLNDDTRHGKLAQMARDVVGELTLTPILDDNGVIVGVEQHGRPQLNEHMDNRNIRGDDVREAENGEKIRLRGWRDKFDHEKGLVDWVDQITHDHVRALSRAYPMLEAFERAGASPGEVAALRQRIAQAPPVEVVRSMLDAAAVHYGVAERFDSVHGLEVADGAGVEYLVLDARTSDEHGTGEAAKRWANDQIKNEWGAPGTVAFVNKEYLRGTDWEPTPESIALGGTLARMDGGPSRGERAFEQGVGRASRGGTTTDREEGGTPGTFMQYLSPEDYHGTVANHGVTDQVVMFTDAVTAQRDAAATHAVENTPDSRAALDQANQAVAAAERVLREDAAPAQMRAVEHHLLSSGRTRHTNVAPHTNIPPHAAAPVQAVAPGPAMDGTFAAEPVHSALPTPGTHSATDTVGPEHPGDRFARLAGWLGIPPTIPGAIATPIGDDQDEDLDDDPLSRPLEQASTTAAAQALDRLQAGLPPAAAETLNQHLDHPAPAAVVRDVTLSDEQALHHLEDRRNRLADELGLRPDQVAGAEGIREVGTKVDQARRELADALETLPRPPAEVDAAIARAVIADAVAQLSQTSTTTEPPAEHVLAAASNYLALTALLDLVVSIHQRTPNGCVNNAVTMMRVLYPDNQHSYRMPEHTPLAGHGSADVQFASGGGSFEKIDSLDKAAEWLENRPRSAIWLVDEWMDTHVTDTDRRRAAEQLTRHLDAGRLHLTDYRQRIARVRTATEYTDLRHAMSDLPKLPDQNPDREYDGIVRSHLRLLHNRSDRPDQPDLVVLDINAGNTRSATLPEDLSGPDALLKKAVRFHDWKKEQEDRFQRLGQKGSRAWILKFTSEGIAVDRDSEPPNSNAFAPQHSDVPPPVSVPRSASAQPESRDQFALAGHRPPEDSDPPEVTGPAGAIAGDGPAFRPSEAERAMETLAPGKPEPLGGGATATYRARTASGKTSVLKPIYLENIQLFPAKSEAIWRPEIRANLDSRGPTRLRYGIPRGGGQLAAREVATYRFDEAAGFGRVPPTGIADSPFGPASNQLMVAAGPSHLARVLEHHPGWRTLSRDEKVKLVEDTLRYPRLHLEQMAVIDYVIGNTDRHFRNYLTGIDGGVVAIDHSFTFPESPDSRFGILSDFVTAFRSVGLSAEILKSIRAIDTDMLRAAWLDAGLRDKAIHGALERLQEIRKRGKITGEAWPGIITGSGLALATAGLPSGWIEWAASDVKADTPTANSIRQTESTDGHMSADERGASGEEIRPGTAALPADVLAGVEELRAAPTGPESDVPDDTDGVSSSDETVVSAEIEEFVRGSDGLVADIAAQPGDPPLAVAALQKLLASRGVEADSAGPGDVSAADPAIAGTDPVAVERCWRSLADAEQRAVVVVYPEVIGRLAGVPVRIRDIALRLALRRSLESAVARAGLTTAEIDPAALSGYGALGRLWAERVRLQEADRRAGAVPGGGPVVYLLDTPLGRNGGRTILAFDNPDVTERVACHFFSGAPDVPADPVVAVRNAYESTLRAGAHNASAIMYLDHDLPAVLPRMRRIRLQPAQRSGGYLARFLAEFSMVRNEPNTPTLCQLDAYGFGSAATALSEAAAGQRLNGIITNLVHLHSEGQGSVTDYGPDVKVYALSPSRFTPVRPVGSDPVEGPQVTRVRAEIPVERAFQEAHPIARRVLELLDYPAHPFSVDAPVRDQCYWFANPHARTFTEGLTAIGLISAGRGDDVQTAPMRTVQGDPEAGRRVRLYKPSTADIPEHPGADDRALVQEALSMRGSDVTIDDLCHQGLPDDWTRAAELATANYHWWNSLGDPARPGELSPTQCALLRRYPAQMSGLPGLPLRAQGLACARQLEQDRARLVPAADDRPRWTEAEVRQLRNVLGMEEALGVATAVRPGIEQPPVCVTDWDAAAFDNDGKAIVHFGDTDTADYVADLIPGMMSDAQTLPRLVAMARNLYESMVGARPGVEVAVRLRLGHDAPSGKRAVLETVRTDIAKSAGQIVRRDLVAWHAKRAAIAESGGSAMPYFTVHSHSYGGVTANFAMRDAELSGIVAKHIMYGVPATGDNEHVSQTGIDTIAMYSPSDPVPTFGATADDHYGRFYKIAVTKKSGMGVGPTYIPAYRTDGKDFGATILPIQFPDRYPFNKRFPAHGYYFNEADPDTGEQVDSLRYAGLIATNQSEQIPHQPRQPHDGASLQVRLDEIGPTGHSPPEDTHAPLESHENPDDAVDASTTLADSTETGLDGHIGAGSEKFAPGGQIGSRPPEEPGSRDDSLRAQMFLSAGLVGVDPASAMPDAAERHRLDEHCDAYLGEFSRLRRSAGDPRLTADPDSILTPQEAEQAVAQLDSDTLATPQQHAIGSRWLHLHRLLTAADELTGGESAVRPGDDVLKQLATVIGLWRTAIGADSFEDAILAEFRMEYAKTVLPGVDAATCRMLLHRCDEIRRALAGAVDARYPASPPPHGSLEEFVGGVREYVGTALLPENLQTLPAMIDAATKSVRPFLMGLDDWSTDELRAYALLDLQRRFLDRLVPSLRETAEQQLRTDLALLKHSSRTDGPFDGPEYPIGARPPENEDELPEAADGDRGADASSRGGILADEPVSGWRVDTAELIDRYVGDTPPSYEQLRMRLRELVDRYPEEAFFREIGRSREDRPMELLSIEGGPHNILLIVDPHPMEPVGRATALAFAEHFCSRSDLRAVYSLHIVVSSDPDSAVLNAPPARADGPVDLASYHTGIHRAAVIDQPEWRFPSAAPQLGMRFNSAVPLPETLAQMGVIKSLRSLLISSSLHNIDSGGVHLFFGISGDGWIGELGPQIPDLLADIAVRHDIPVESIPGDVAELSSWFEKIGNGVYANRRVHGQAFSGTFAGYYGGLPVTIEVPEWETRPSSVTRSEAIDLLEQRAEVLEELLRRLPPDIAPSTFSRAAESGARYARDQAEALRRDPDKVFEPGIVHRSSVRRMGGLLRHIDEALLSHPDHGELRLLREDVNRHFLDWVQFQRDDQNPVWRPLRSTAGMQLEFLFALVPMARAARADASTPEPVTSQRDHTQSVETEVPQGASTPWSRVGSAVDARVERPERPGSVAIGSPGQVSSDSRPDISIESAADEGRGPGDESRPDAPIGTRRDDSNPGRRHSGPLPTPWTAVDQHTPNAKPRAGDDVVDSVWRVDGARLIDEHVGDTSPTYEELRRRLRDLADRYPDDVARFSEIGRTREGRPMELLSVYGGPRNVLLVVDPHPMESVGRATALAIAQHVLTEPGLRSEVSYHFIVCSDPDTAVMNAPPARTVGPVDLAKYYTGIARPVRHPEWSFLSAVPVPGMRLNSEVPLPETLAQMGVIKALRPLLLSPSLHNIDSGGAFLYFGISGDGWIGELGPRIPDLFADIAVRHGIPVESAPIDVALLPSWYENIGNGVHANRRVPGEAFSGTFVGYYGGLPMTIEVPEWITRPSSLGRREAIDLLKRRISILDELTGRLYAESRPSVFSRSADTYAAMLRGNIDVWHSDPNSPFSPHLVHVWTLRNCGQLLRHIDGASLSNPGISDLEAIRTDLNSKFLEWVQFQRDDQNPVWRPLRSTAGMQLEFILATIPGALRVADRTGRTPKAVVSAADGELDDESGAASPTEGEAVADLTIEAATPADIEPLSEHFGESWILEDRLLRQDRGDGVLFVARHGGRPVAHGYLWLEDAEEPEIRSGLPGVALINHLEVAEGLRGRHIGSELIARMERFARVEAGRDRIALAVLPSNTGAVRLYERLGYVDWGQGTVQCYDVVEREDGSRVRVPDPEQARVLVKDLVQRPLSDDSRSPPPSLPAFTPTGGGSHRVGPDSGGVGRAVLGGHAVDAVPDHVKELLRHTGVGRRVLAALESMPVRERFELMGEGGHRGGEWVDSALAATVFTSGNDYAVQALSLAHEVVHAEFFVDDRTVRDPLSMSVDEYVRARVAEETACFRIMAELAPELRSLGLDIPLQVTEAAYDVAYDKAVRRRTSAALTPEQVHQQAHASALKAAEQEVATFEWADGRSYRRFYRDDYRAWEKAGHTRSPDGTVTAARHPRRYDLTPEGARRMRRAALRYDHDVVSADDLSRRLAEMAAELGVIGGPRSVTRARVAREIAALDAELATGSPDRLPELRRRQHRWRELSDLADEYGRLDASIRWDRVREMEDVLAADVVDRMASTASGAQRISDRAVLVPGTPRRLVIVGGPGEHQAVLADPRVAAARRGAQVEYCHVQVQPGGEPHVWTLIAPTAVLRPTPLRSLHLAERATRQRMERIRAELGTTQVGGWALEVLHDVEIVQTANPAEAGYKPVRRRLVLDAGMSDEHHMAHLVHQAIHVAVARGREAIEAVREQLTSPREAYIDARIDEETRAHAMEIVAALQLRAAGYDVPEPMGMRAYTDAYYRARASLVEDLVRAGQPVPDRLLPVLDRMANDAGLAALRPEVEAHVESYQDLYGRAWDAAQGVQPFAEQVQAARRSGERTVRALGGGVPGVRNVELVSYNDGAVYVRMALHDSRSRHAAVLSSLLGRAFDVPMPRVVADGDVLYFEPTSWALPVELGRPGFGSTGLGLHDALVGFPDSADRVVVERSDQVAWSNHHRAFESAALTPETVSRFAQRFLRARADGTVEFIAHDVPRSELEWFRDRAEKLRPDFERLGRADWHDVAMARLAEIEAHARPDPASGEESAARSADSDSALDAVHPSQQAIRGPPRADVESVVEEGLHRPSTPWSQMTPTTNDPVGRPNSTGESRRPDALDHLKQSNTAQGAADLEGPAGPIGTRPPEGEKPMTTGGRIYSPFGYVAGGIRRFDTDREGELYGEQHLGYMFKNLSPAQQEVAIQWTVGSRAFNELLRPDGLPEPAELARRLNDWYENPADEWRVRGLIVGAVPTLEEVYALEGRTDLSPAQARVVSRVLSSENPARELSRVFPKNASMKPVLTVSYGKWPTAEEIIQRTHLLDESVNNPLPEGLRVECGFRNWDLLKVVSSPYELVGRQFMYPGYRAASLGKRLDTFDMPTRAYVAHMTLDAPKGTPALWIGRKSRYPRQREILFPRNLICEITRVSYRGPGLLPHTTPWRIWATVVGVQHGAILAPDYPSAAQLSARSTSDRGSNRDAIGRVDRRTVNSRSADNPPDAGTRPVQAPRPVSEDSVPGPDYPIGAKPPGDERLGAGDAGTTEVLPGLDSPEEMSAFGELGKAVREHGVVVGRAAAAAALGGRSTVVEWSVPEWLYRRIAGLPAWTVRSSDHDEGQRSVGGFPADRWPRRSAASPVLECGHLRVSVGWPGLVPVPDRRSAEPGGEMRELVSHDALRERAWRTERGIRVAGLPDVMAWTQERDLPADIDTARWMKDALLNPARPRLPEQVLAREAEEVIDILHSTYAAEGNSLPDLAAADTQRAIRLIAEGLYVARTLYGDPRIGRSNHLHGSVELREFQVAAFYHDGDIAAGLRSIVENGLRQNGRLGDILLAMAAAAWSDSVYGEGRKRDNPDGHDEKRSGELVRHLTMAHGLDVYEARMVEDAVLATTFVEGVGTQAVAFNDNVQQQRRLIDQGARRGIGQWVAGEDLHSLSTPEAVIDCVRLAAEDLLSSRFDKARTFGRVLAKLGTRANYLAEALRLIHVYRDMRVEGPGSAGMTLGEAFAARLRGNAEFIDPDSSKGYRYPDGWVLGNRDMRRDHAVLLRQIAHKLETDGEYTPQDALREAEDHAGAMRVKYRGFRWQQVFRPGEQPWDPAAIADSLARRLPGGDRPGRTREVIDGVIRVAELVAADAADAHPSPDGKADAAIVVTMCEDADGSARLRAQLDYSVRGKPPIRSALQRALTGVNCRISIEDAIPLSLTEHYPHCRILLDFADPIADDERDRTGFTDDDWDDPVTVPITVGTDNGAVDRRARFLIEGALGGREYTERFAPIVGELIKRCAKTDIAVETSGRNDSFGHTFLVGMRGGEWDLALAATAEQTPTTARVRFTLALKEGSIGESDETLAVLTALLPDAPLFAETLATEVAPLAPDGLTITVTGDPGSRTVEIVLPFPTTVVRIVRHEPDTSAEKAPPLGRGQLENATQSVNPISGMATIRRVSAVTNTPDAARGIPEMLLDADPSFTIHICTKDRPDRLSKLLADIASVVPAIDTVFVYDDSVDWINRARNRSAMQSMPFHTVCIDESRRRELLQDLPWPPDTMPFADYAFKELGKPEWDPAGVRALAHFVAAVNASPGSKILFLDDDIRLMGDIFQGKMHPVDSEAIKELLAGPPRPGIVLGAEYVGRPDIYDVEHVQLELAASTSEPWLFGRPGSKSVHFGVVEKEPLGGENPLSGAFLLVDYEGVRLAPIPHYYNEDVAYVAILQACGHRIEVAPFKPLHTGDDKHIRWRTALMQQVGMVVQKSLEQALRRVPAGDWSTVVARAAALCDQNAKASVTVWKEVFADPHRRFGELHAHNIYALIDAERIATEARKTISTYFRQFNNWQTLMADRGVSNYVREFIARVRTSPVREEHNALRTPDGIPDRQSPEPDTAAEESTPEPAALLPTGTVVDPIATAADQDRTLEVSDTAPDRIDKAAAEAIPPADHWAVDGPGGGNEYHDTTAIDRDRDQQ